MVLLPGYEHDPQARPTRCAFHGRHRHLLAPRRSSSQHVPFSQFFLSVAMTVLFCVSRIFFFSLKCICLFFSFSPLSLRTPCSKLVPLATKPFSEFCVRKFKPWPGLRRLLSRSVLTIPTKTGSPPTSGSASTPALLPAPQTTRSPESPRSLSPRRSSLEVIVTSIFPPVSLSPSTIYWICASGFTAADRNLNNFFGTSTAGQTSSASAYLEPESIINPSAYIDNAGLTDPFPFPAASLTLESQLYGAGNALFSPMGTE